MNECLKETSWQEENLDFSFYEVKSISMPGRIQRALLHLGIMDLRAVEGVCEQELLRLRNFGESSLAKLNAICREYGIREGSRTAPKGRDRPG